MYCAVSVTDFAHSGRVTHTCVSKLTIIGSDNGLSPGRRQAIIWSNTVILLIRALGINFSEILNGIHMFSFKKMFLKMSTKWRQFCLGLSVLTFFLKFCDTYIRQWAESAFIQVMTFRMFGATPLLVPKVTHRLSVELLCAIFSYSWIKENLPNKTQFQYGPRKTNINKISAKTLDINPRTIVFKNIVSKMPLELVVSVCE